ncbi:NADPH-dependent FMN reductase [Collimonas sp. NPDC087041]|uniref:NADPH-dependent FMN reductase n=1 Tax=Collimonas sp. NPDC087041 TaxID=3363960 RepID=UPI0038309B84
MTNRIRILGVAGSLRAQSYNLMLLQAAQELLPAEVELEIYSLEDLPLYNQELEQDLPASVLRLKQAIKRADAILFTTPEYNYSIPGVLKNAIDWASRPGGESAWAGKPAAIAGASPGVLGTARAQYHLRQILVALDVTAVNQPEVMIGNASERFDANGRLVDDKSRHFFSLLLNNLLELIRRFPQKGGEDE